MTPGKSKGFGLVSKNAREKAAEQATKTLNNVDASPNDNATPTQPLEPPTATATEQSAANTDARPVALAPVAAAAVASGAESSVSEPTVSVSPDVKPSMAEPQTKPTTNDKSRKSGTSKKGADSMNISTPAMNAARVSPRAHKLLNMISSLENKTQSEVIDELMVLHPLYKKLKDLVQ